MQDIIIPFLIAGAIGSLLGADQEIVKSHSHKGKKSQAIITTGIRSSILISLLGALMAHLGQEMGATSITLTLGMVPVIGLILAAYIYTAFRHDQYGITREFGSIFAYILGAMVVLGYEQLAIMLAIALAILFMSKSKMRKLFSRITHEELFTTLKFCVISLIILPLLPSEKFALNDIPGIGISHPITEMPFFNPYSIWLFVVLMSGVSYIGYILSKVIGSEKGIGVSGAIGGLVSSTAVTSSMAAQSKEQPGFTHAFVFSTLIANAIMFVRVLFIVAIFHAALLADLVLPVLSMLFIVIVCIVYFARSSKRGDPRTHEKNFESPFQIGPALTFALFIIGIKFFSGVALIYQDFWGEYALYAVSFFSGFADVDAITQDMSVKSLSGDILNNVATLAIVIAIFTNTLVKMCIAKFFGEKRYGNSVFYSLALVCVVGLAFAL